MQEISLIRQLRAVPARVFTNYKEKKAVMMHLHIVLFAELQEMSFSLVDVIVYLRDAIIFD